jgi:RimJ/RimL family protein N-acetyltransferase
MREHRGRTASDTSKITIRPIDGSDVFLLADGFARLSDRSRQLRFLGAKPSLSPAELDHFTNVDHRNADALVALSVADGRGIGVARYTRDPNDSAAAELAVTVVDEWHRRGVGKELIHRLISRAKGQGISRFTALVSDDNVASINLLHSLGLDVTVLQSDYHTTEYEISLDDARSRC